ncbi:hypothetical protein RMSM_07173 [Rhodopirellula maiorica SM1]|uniref:DUF4145 domain-containing protein n=1 Tax=Rhodopirellula maiorica SM1 TaxID=1265738 RepID=M5R8T7_9BACT|nr:hypothetical protein [Rhodopirellula maiorica]EMI15903.1 hypothetical protein RMSM_07173 [Rhodopirellula maiorica SM1]
MPNKEFLETYPLYRKLEMMVPSSVDEIPSPAINGICGKCGSLQTFRQTNDWYELSAYRNSPTHGQVVRAEYICHSCKSFLWTFYLRFGDDCDSVTKVGQWPAWSIAVDAGLAKILGQHASNYRKGLVCESQSYGIGAFAYYRRIVEQLIDRLLDEIEDLIPEADKQTYVTALAATKKTIVAQEKIALVKDLLPPILRPDGMNPLSLLHTTLSEGLHGQSDEQCLNKAEHIRNVLVFLVNQVMQAKESANTFTASMRKLLDRKSNSNS